MKSGFIKLHRQITEHWLWSAEPYDRAHAWIDLLLQANWATNKRLINGQLIEQQRGEVLTSIHALAVRWKWSDNKVRRFLHDLAAEGMIQADGRAYGTSITIENYTFFQDERRANGRADERADGRADGRQHKKNKEEIKKTRAREDEPEAVSAPAWFVEKVEQTFGRKGGTKQ